MFSNNNNPVVKVTKENIDAVNKLYGIDEDRINENLVALEEWLVKETHLVEASKYITREYIARFFIQSKASLENTKKKIDKVLTLRVLMPELCLKQDTSEFDNIFETVKYVPLPNISPKDTARICIIQLVPERANDFSLLQLIRYTNMIAEIRLHYDYFLGERIVVDMGQMSMISKLNPVVMKKSDLLSEAYGLNVIGIHVLNAPPFVDAIINLVKQTMREKVSSKLHIHRSYEELYDYIPREILPQDFGGDELPMAKLCEQWKDYLKTEEVVKLVAESNKIISDESKRNSRESHEAYMGIPGSFRRLNVD